jgi:hypothetical protein
MRKIPMRRLSIRGSYAITICIACTIFGRTAPLLFADGDGSKKAQLDAIVQRLAQQERVVRSCECLLSYRADPTSREMIPLIEKELRKRPRIGRYIFTKKDAARRTYAGHWWRSGIKERFDQFPTFELMAQPGSKPVRSQAFDGKVIRDYNYHDKPNPVNGAIVEGSIEKADRLGAVLIGLRSSTSMEMSPIRSSWRTPRTRVSSRPMAKQR